MKPKPAITKLTITVAGQTIDLTLEEARELKKVLNDALEPTVNWPRIEREVIREVPCIWPSPRPILWGVEPSWDTTPRITCGSSENSMLALSR